MQRVRRVDQLRRRFYQRVRACDLSDDVDRRRTILMVSAATRSEIPWWRVRRVDQLRRNFDQCVDGQMWMFLAAMCRSIEYLHDDRSYVLIGDQSDKFDDGSGFGGRGGASSGGDSTLRTSDCGGAVGRSH